MSAPTVASEAVVDLAAIAIHALLEGPLAPACAACSQGSVHQPDLDPRLDLQAMRERETRPVRYRIALPL